MQRRGFRTDFFARRRHRFAWLKTTLWLLLAAGGVYFWLGWNSGQPYPPAGDLSGHLHEIWLNPDWYFRAVPGAFLFFFAVHRLIASTQTTRI